MLGNVIRTLEKICYALDKMLPVFEGGYAIVVKKIQ